MDFLPLIPSFAFFIWAEYQDAVTSRFYPLYTTGEANPLARGKDGYYSLTKSVRNTAIVAGIVIALSFLDVPYLRLVLAGLVAGMGAVIYFAVVKNNIKKLNNQRAKQADYLEHFTLVNYLHLRVFKNTWVVPSFYDIRVPILGPTIGVESGPELLRASAELTKKFEVLKANPDLWWSLDRAQKIEALMARV
jgi:hypothetical protein